eukprot:gene3062-39102_t
MLRENAALPAPVQERIRALTQPGTNAYGIMLNALWPGGLTRVGPVRGEFAIDGAAALQQGRTAGACTAMLGRAAKCVAETVAPPAIARG